MLGRDVMLAAGNAGHDVVGFGRAELDVTDAAALEKKFDLERPDGVINCAARTAVGGPRGGGGGRGGGGRGRSPATAPATSPPPRRSTAPASSTSPATTSSTAPRPS